MAKKPRNKKGVAQKEKVVDQSQYIVTDKDREQIYKGSGTDLENASRLASGMLTQPTHVEQIQEQDGKEIEPKIVREYR